MQDAKTSLRIKQIVRRICQEPNYTTISAIAKDLGVSAKTVLRELAAVERWLAARGCSLSKKTGAGIKLTGNETSKKHLLESLSSEEEKEETIYTPQERQTILISELLQNQEPVKLYSFAALLKVTEGTISNDLDKAEPWFAGHDLTLVRKPGLGVYIEGQEQNIRKAMVQFIYKNVDEHQLLRLIRNNLMRSAPDAPDVEVKTRKRLLNLVDKEVIHRLEASIREAEAKMGYKLADSAYVGLIVHLALALQRIRQGEKIVIDPVILTELNKCPEYVIAADMAAGIANHFAVAMPQDEIGYITMHLKGSKNRTDYIRPAGKPLGSFQLVKNAREMIKTAENATGYNLAQNKELLIGLVNHLGPSISRLKMNMDIRNPFLDNMKTSYPGLLEISRQCARVVEEQIGIAMPESEIAYIAMHLGAAIENCERLSKPVYRCAIACATGIGTSRLLVTRIEKEYDNIEIVDTISTLYVEENWLRQHSIDFIISTVGMENCSLPVVTVNPLLFEGDKAKIDNQLKMLKYKARFSAVKKGDQLQLQDRLVLLNHYNKAILEILENFFLLEDRASETIDDIIAGVSAVLQEHPDSRTMLASALRQREEKGGTFITGYQLILFHCRTSLVKQLYFGAVKIGRDISVVNGNGEPEAVKLGIIMLAPEDCAEPAVETISHISRMLIERPEFTRLLREGAGEEARQELFGILEEFYKFHSNRLMGA